MIKVAGLLYHFHEENLHVDLTYHPLILIFSMSVWIQILYLISLTVGPSIYCGVPGSPCLSKTGLVLARIFKILSSLSVCVHLLTD